jgi:RNA-directed DNA polymerase
MTTTPSTWKQIPWNAAIREVRKLQAAIVRAQQRDDAHQVCELQNRLVGMQAAKWLAVQQVTSTHGKQTPGIDGRLWDTPERKFEAARSLDPQSYHPQPARRVNIPKGEHRLRPLGILTMRDRAMQALYMLALDPVAETWADPHSYGFRKYRSTADAIAVCTEIFASGERPWWILNADIENCFETISHEWLLAQMPLDPDMLHGWLTAGYIEKGRHYTPAQGLPQGGILSPKLMNMTLDSLEAVLETIATERRRRRALYLIRYADDFVVISKKKRWLREMVRPVLDEFLRVRGMRLSEEKTTLIHLKQGLDFLGFHLSLKKGAVCVEPTQQAVTQIVDKVTTVLRMYPQAEPAEMIQRLNPIIRGWTEHYKHVEHRKRCVEADVRIARQVWTWVKERQHGVFKSRQAKQHFVAGPGKLRLLCDRDGHTLFCTQAIPWSPHIAIDPACNPYDPKWNAYLKERQQTKKNSG